MRRPEPQLPCSTASPAPAGPKASGTLITPLYATGRRGRQEGTWGPQGGSV